MVLERYESCKNKYAESTTYADNSPLFTSKFATHPIIFNLLITCFHAIMLSQVSWNIKEKLPRFVLMSNVAVSNIHKNVKEIYLKAHINEKYKLLLKYHHYTNL